MCVRCLVAVCMYFSTCIYVCFEVSGLTNRLKFREWCFSHAGPKAWNKLPTELQDLMDRNAFRRQLKTFLFERAFTTQ